MDDMMTVAAAAVADPLATDIAAIGRIDAVPTILDVVCRTTGMGFAAVARVTDGRWVACGVNDTIDFGLSVGGELNVETTICHEIRQDGAPVVIDDVTTHPIYATHPTPALYGFQSYISVPIRLRSGEFFGTLCAIDPRPHVLSESATIGMFQMFADLIAFHLDSDERLARSEASLLDERATAELREQFIAVLGHDLRNPLASVASGVRLLAGDPPREKANRILALMQGSVDRMAGLIDNVLDLARGRLGNGLSVTQAPVDLLPVLTQVVDELRAGHPDRRIDCAIALPPILFCDARRVGQLCSNLLGNALTHGDRNAPVTVAASVDDGRFTLAVANGAKQLSPAAIARLFQPFARGAVNPDENGLGLGLYIASEIAKAHGGTLAATSDADTTRFTFTMPLH